MPLIRKQEAAVIIGLLAVTLSVLLFRRYYDPNGSQIRGYIIYINGEEARNGPLLFADGSTANDVTFSLTERESVIFKIEAGTIAVVESDCPDKICVRTGKLSRFGQSAVCLPNGVIVMIAEQTDERSFIPDAVTGRGY